MCQSCSSVFEIDSGRGPLSGVVVEGRVSRGKSAGVAVSVGHIVGTVEEEEMRSTLSQI